MTHELRVMTVGYRLQTCCTDTEYKASDTLENFLSKVAFESNLRKKLSRIEHVLIVKVAFEEEKIRKFS